MKEYLYEKLLNIKTKADQKKYNNSVHYHPYEPTPYSALEKLFNEYELNTRDRLVDFGCGKGRLNFYVHYLYDATVVGVEMNETFYRDALANRISYLKKNKGHHENIPFHCCFAEAYQINSLDNRFYFFNPFSIQIFMKIINNILLSVEKYRREIELILYYGSDEYIYFLENNTSFALVNEITVPGWYEQNSYERFLIYRLG